MFFAICSFVPFHMIHLDDDFGVSVSRFMFMKGTITCSLQIFRPFDSHHFIRWFCLFPVWTFLFVAFLFSHIKRSRRFSLDVNRSQTNSSRLPVRWAFASSHAMCCTRTFLKIHLDDELIGVFITVLSFVRDFHRTLGIHQLFESFCLSFRFCLLSVWTSLFVAYLQAMFKWLWIFDLLSQCPGSLPMGWISSRDLSGPFRCHFAIDFWLSHGLHKSVFCCSKELWASSSFALYVFVSGQSTFNLCLSQQCQEASVPPCQQCQDSAFQVRSNASMGLHLTLALLCLICSFSSGNSFRLLVVNVTWTAHFRFLMYVTFCIPSILVFHKSFRTVRDLFDFDHTCGFPGEGPSWSCISSNVNAVNSHPHCLEWTDDLVCIQEARLSSTSIQTHRNYVLTKGRDFFYAKLLQPTRQKNGVKHVPHGGTACIAPKDACRNFTEHDDATNLWKELADSTRVCAVWVQIQPKLKLLAFNLYGQATMNGVSSHDINNLYLEKIFTITSQFGDVPIIICGDFQDDPDTFASVQHAKHYAGWSDPISKFCDDGSTYRPITYSRDSNFDDPTDNFSSIDGILLNRVAMSALSSIDVLHTEARQHSPIRATFKWERVFQKGYTLVKPAALDISRLPTKNGKLDQDLLENTAQKLWNEKFEVKCSQKDDKKAWQSINNFAIQALCQQGACFKKGPRTRGEQPRLRPHIACPGQDIEGTVLTSKSAKLSKVHKLLCELRFRLARSASNTADFNITLKLQTKVAFELSNLKGFDWWDKEHHLNSHGLNWAQVQLQKLIIDQRFKEKRARISAWKQKMIDATKTKQVDKCVFQWINGKTKMPSPNIILNKNGDIILAPTDAIVEINDQWDSIFASNIHHTNPEEVLAKIWPVIKDSYSKVDLPPITAEDLKAQAARRKPNAAPGLDGWRTVEVQSFPLVVWASIATYFCQVESGLRSLPENLTLAKQIILDKGSDDAPLSKRLISLLSVLLLSYTGLRYRQLQEWQHRCLPRQLFGGIKHRKMSSVHSQMQLQIDIAHANNDELVGLKLDKSKCFDRMVPSIVASLFVAFGLPLGLTRFFMSMYQGLKRYMCYKQWISTRATTAPNGLVQGCSLSLLAINLQMSVWALMLEKISEVSLAIFIDDSYMWARANHHLILQRAFELTTEWDALVGQVLNMKKCQIWGTSSSSRAIMRSIFPQMQLCLTLEVLGATVHTSNAIQYEWPTKKTTKILRDLQLIKSIPCPRQIQEHLISVKVIPQLTFAAHLNGIPKKALSSIQNAVADGLWRGRPMSRSKGMLMAIIADPDRCDPFAARAYSTVIDTLDFLKHTDPTHRQAWKIQFESGYIRPNSLIHHFFQATTILSIEMVGPFHMTMWEASPVSVLDFAKRDLKGIIKIAVRHACYSKASYTSRKDIAPAQNILDLYATRLANAKCKNVLHKGLPLQCHRDASIVGSCLTNDRRAAAGHSDTDLCRFCSAEKETFAHLAHDCMQLPFQERPFCNLSKGTNFGNLGIVETPHEQVKRRLQISSISDIPVEIWSNVSKCVQQHVWSDGSCEFTDDFWSTIGGYAVVSFHGKVLQKGPVFHWALSAYSCELWALIVAFATSEYPIVCHSDCLSLCNQVVEMITYKKVNPTWPHLEWWNFLYQVFESRLQWADVPLQVKWCPAHILEHLPLEMISNQQAREHNTTWLNIARNREADKQAKRACVSQKTLTNDQRACDHKSIIDWQLWITNICALVSESSVGTPKKSQPWGAVNDALKNSDEKCSVFHDDLTILHPTEVFAKILPKWDWYLDPQECDWIPDFDSQIPLRSYAKISSIQWETALRFFNGLRWMSNDSKKMAFIEIAYHAWYSGWVFPEIDANPASYSSFLKKIINQAHKIKPLALCPGPINPSCKSFGKTLPTGFIEKSTFVMHSRAIKQLAIDACHRSQALKSWSCPFSP